MNLGLWWAKRDGFALTNFAGDVREDVADKAPLGAWLIRIIFSHFWTSRLQFQLRDAQCSMLNFYVFFLFISLPYISGRLLDLPSLCNDNIHYTAKIKIHYKFKPKKIIEL